MTEPVNLRKEISSEYPGLTKISIFLFIYNYLTEEKIIKSNYQLVSFSNYDVRNIRCVAWSYYK